MEEHIRTITQKYDDFYKFLLKKGRFAVKDTAIGFWGPTPANELVDMFNEIGIKNYAHFLDLGSGDGKAVLIASLFTKATGIEFDPWLVEVSLSMRQKLAHIPGIRKATFLRENFLEHDLNRYDVIFCAPDQPMERHLEEKLESELNGDLVVYGHHFHPSRLQKKREFKIRDVPLTIYNKK